MKVMVTLFERNDPMTGEARTFTVGESDDADLPRSIAGAVYEVVRRMVSEAKGDLPFTPMDDDEDDLRVHDVPRLEVTDLPIAIWEDMTDNAA